MCDLSAVERDAVLAELDPLTELVERINASTRSIRDRDWMDHAELDQMLGQLADQAVQARNWVAAKVAATHH